MEKITFTGDGDNIDFYIIEQTTLQGQTYLLVTEDESDEDADAYILKEIGGDGDDVTYEIVEDDVTLDALGKLFSELLDDVDITS